MAKTDGSFPQQKFRAYTMRNIDKHPRWAGLPADLRHAVEIVSHVLPFKVNDYVLDELIDWSAIPQDPIFQLTFPQPGMLTDQQFRRVEEAARDGGANGELQQVVNEIRLGLNPHPAGQMELNVPVVEGEPIPGTQHKYNETVLFFPAAGQTCHSYCTFCFRWPQFVGMPEHKFAARETEDLVAYLQAHPEVTDLLLTGGDPMVMSTEVLRRYLQPVLDIDPVRPSTIRIGTKALTYWPARFVTDDDADDLLRFFEQIVTSGRGVAVMAHFNHYAELSTPIVREAIRRVRATGAVIRTQSPVIRHINDDSEVWRRLWQESVELGMIPYYMFVERDTGARDYFSIPLVQAWETYRAAASAVSGLARTVRGPSMSTIAGKVEILGPADLGGERVMALRFLQGRSADWTYRPFFAQWDESATWLNELRPADGSQRFFFEDELDQMISRD